MGSFEWLTYFVLKLANFDKKHQVCRYARSCQRGMYHKRVILGLWHVDCTQNMNCMFLFTLVLFKDMKSAWKTIILSANTCFFLFSKSSYTTLPYIPGIFSNYSWEKSLWKDDGLYFLLLLFPVHKILSFYSYLLKYLYLAQNGVSYSYPREAHYSYHN